MNLFDNINIVTLLMACLFIIPIAYGILRSFSSNRARNLFMSLFSNIGLILSIVLAIYLTNILVVSHENAFLHSIYTAAQNISIWISGRIIWTNIILIIFMTAVIDAVYHVLMIPVYNRIITPLSNRIYESVRSMNNAIQRIIGGVWQLPKSIGLVLIFSLFLSGYAGYYSDSIIAAHAQSSMPYQLIQQDIIQPLFQSSVVRDIQVLFNDTFTQTAGDQTRTGFDAPLIQYFNGVTLNEAIQSNSQIDAKALEVIGSATTDREKALRIYEWICQNIAYDYDKAVLLSEDATQVSSGAVVAFEMRKGICFDFSCLYVAMCRQAGLPVRFITGSAFSGTVWGDHAWNEVYDSQGNVWIPVDTTFGSTGPDYFGNANFDSDHSNSIVQGEW